MKLNIRGLQLLCAAGALLGISATLSAETKLPATDEAKSQMIDWLRNNNKFGPDDTFVKQIGDQIASDIDNVNLLELTIGSGMTRSGKTCRVCAFAGEFFAFEMTDGQGEAAGTKPSSVDYSTGTKTRDRRESPPIAKVSELAINNAAALNGGDKVTGTVTVDVTGELPKMKPALRLTVLAERNTKSSFVYPEVKAGSNKLDFSFGPLNDADGKPIKGPYVVYIDFCTVNADGGKVETNLLGNTVATLVNVQ
ncbi:MAG: hypothetical protein K8T25_13015 [Planctomycetia bacterium]|nr:hypothetical protein [Planctomycetia bacterium]